MCIQTFIQFSEFLIETLINSSNKVNKIELSFARKLGSYICKTNVDVEKIDGSRLETYEMIIALF